MGNLVDWLKGKKTYLLMALGAVVIVVNHLVGGIPGLNIDPNSWLTQLYAVAGGSALRAGIAKVGQ